MKPSRVYVLLIVLLAFVGNATAVPPRVIDDRCKLELITSDPQIVTPVGMAFDRQGRLLVVESNTHQRAKEYNGPATDRIRMFSDSDGDGKLDKWSTFAEGFRFAMNLLVRDDGGVYVVERGRITLLRDTDDDGVADKQEVILRLETEADYPHNGLSGIARDVDGSLIIGLGENFGLPYELRGTDGVTFKGTGGQDGFFRISPEGKQLERISRGVWNPFSICALPDGRVFAVDNDPDSSPPCRLLHVVPGGDYGYLFQFGRAGTHPLQSWNGELPGTLPYVCGVGEAPSAIVPLAGSLWVTSWGDHRVERYDLVPRGGSYGATRTVVVQGDADFRPTGMAIAPDGSLYFADWVLRDYPVHGHGKLWRLSLPKDELQKKFSLPSADEAADQNELTICSKDPFIRVRRVWKNAHSDEVDHYVTSLAESSSSVTQPEIELGMLEALRWHGTSQAEAVLRTCLQGRSRDVQLYALRWIGDDRITTLRDDVAKFLEGPQTDRQIYLAALGALDWLDREPGHRRVDFSDELLVGELSNEKRSPEAHALALSLLNPSHRFLTVERLNGYAHSPSEALRLEAVRSLAERAANRQAEGDCYPWLAEIARDESQSSECRAEAVLGISAARDKYRLVLGGFAKSSDPVVQKEAARGVRLYHATDRQERGEKAESGDAGEQVKPSSQDVTAWVQLTEKPGEAGSGRRLFFSPVGPRCSLCHTYAGRGGKVGPDLTKLASNSTREKILASILQPSQEIAPDYQPWILVTTTGKSHTALRLQKPGDDGKENYVDSNGETFTLASEEIEERRAADKSIMPDNLQSMLTIEDMRDLVTFLTTPQ